jgi:putative FmdB family regulatory protein
MPLYEYECQVCGHRFEVIQKFSDAPIAACPKCSGVVEKLVSSPAIQFKGSGFYLTDYGRGGKSDMGPGKSDSGDKADKSDTAEKSGKAGQSAKGDAAPSSPSGGGDSPTKTTESKPAPPAAPAAKD